MLGRVSAFYGSVHGEDLELARLSDGRTPAGFTGQITGSGFTKRNFGQTLIEGFLSQQNITHIIDTSGVDIPGHNTPTVIILGRHQGPVGLTIRAALGLKEEGRKLDSSEIGSAWSEIIDLIDAPGSQGEFVSVEDIPRSILNEFPWSLDGGGAHRIKSILEEGSAPLSSRSSRHRSNGGDRGG